MALFAVVLILLVLVIGGAAVLVAAEMPRRSLPEICNEAIRDHFKKALPGLVKDVLREPQFKWFWFVKEMQWEMMRVDPKLSGKRAWELAFNAYRTFLADEGVEFGDPQFHWSKDGAREVIRSYEIEHWESAA